MARKFCKHYRGMFKVHKCEADVFFDTLEHYGTPKFHDSCPCFGPDHPGECKSKVYPTAEEMEEKDLEIEDLFAKITKAREAIVEDCGGPWKRGTPASSGKINCPACGQTEALHYRRAGVNGHIHATCSTKGCVSWIE